MTALWCVPSPATSPPQVSVLRPSSAQFLRAVVCCRALATLRPNVSPAGWPIRWRRAPQC
eukprot:11651278-Karenia_brevis.AAC.1